VEEDIHFTISIIEFGH